MKLCMKGFLLSACLLAPIAHAAMYNVPLSNESLIGEIQYYSANPNDNVLSLQQRYNLGYNAIELANPHLNPTQNMPDGAIVTIPSQHLLPNQPREGIVINLPEMRMYYYPPNSHQVLTFPIGIGKIGKTIPITKTAVTRKVENPTWVPPSDIREFNLKQGIVLPRIMRAGPDNPLGPYAIYMRVPTYLIHSTIFPESVGKRASFGCIRMYESDIKTFFPTVQGGMSVSIINSPVKVGWQDDRVFVEVHPPLEEHQEQADASLSGMVHLVNETIKNKPVLVDWQLLSFLSQHRDGIPHEVGTTINH